MITSGVSWSESAQKRTALFHTQPGGCGERAADPAAVGQVGAPAAVSSPKVAAWRRLGFSSRTVLTRRATHQGRPRLQIRKANAR